MKEKVKQISEKLAIVGEILPDEKKEFLLGFVEGVAAMAKKQEEDEKPEEKKGA